LTKEIEHGNTRKKLHKNPPLRVRVDDGKSTLDRWRLLYDTILFDLRLRFEGNLSEGSKQRGYRLLGFCLGNPRLCFAELEKARHHYRCGRIFISKPPRDEFSLSQILLECGEYTRNMVTGSLSTSQVAQLS